MSEKLKEKTNVSSPCKSNCLLDHGETDSYLGENKQEINCRINFKFHPEMKGKMVNCYFNLEELMNILEEEIQSVSGGFSTKVDIEEFYNAEQEAIETNKIHPPEILYKIENPFLDKDLRPIEILSPKKEVLQKIIDLIKNNEKK